MGEAGPWTVSRYGCSRRGCSSGTGSTALARGHGRQAIPGTYAFRGYTRGNRVVLLSDATETPASLTWLLLHELAHVQVNNAPMLDKAFSSVPRPANYLTSDAAHERYPEEQMANLVADQLAPHFDSRPGLNRIWWRRRVRSR